MNTDLNVANADSNNDSNNNDSNNNNNVSNNNNNNVARMFLNGVRKTLVQKMQTKRRSRRSKYLLHLKS